ncbi:MAG: hypothetical protein H7146_03810 [Burkholderiaceae bacterium]|nr:hypothetical protein [Microbacteriaceae bacterium]
MTTPQRRTAAIAFGGLSLAAALTGCAADASSGETPAASSTTTGPYTDGSYTASGDYQSPGGQESIKVDVTLAGDVVTAVTVTPDATSGNAVRYQTEFAGGIAAEVVGVNIDQLAVDKVAGSSLTSDGFNAAIEKIKADAAS